MTLSIDVLTKEIHSLLGGADLTQITVKQVEAKLVKEPHNIKEEDIVEHKDEIEKIVTTYILEKKKDCGEQDDKDEEPLMATDKTGEKTTSAAFNKKRFLDNTEEVLDASIPGFGANIKLAKRKFNTGSCGWFGNGKITATVDNVPLEVSCQITCTVVGSKEWSDEGQ